MIKMKIFLFVLSVLFIFSGRSICQTQMNLQPSNLASDSMKNIPIDPLNNLPPIPYCFQMIENYSPSIGQKLKEGFTEKYDKKDYGIVIDAIQSLLPEFQKWDSLPVETRRKLEVAHQHAWRLLSMTYERTENLDVKLSIFRFYNTNFKSDGKHLASLLHEIPQKLPPVQEIIDENPPASSDFLTAHLWELFRRTEDPAVVAGIVTLIYRTDSAAGYDELQAKQIQIQNSTLPPNQKELIQYNIGKALSMKSFESSRRDYEINKLTNKQADTNIPAPRGVGPASAPPFPVLNSDLPESVPYMRALPQY